MLMINSDADVSQLKWNMGNEQWQINQSCDLNQLSYFDVVMFQKFILLLPQVC